MRQLQGCLRFGGTRALLPQAVTVGQQSGITEFHQALVQNIRCGRCDLDIWISGLIAA